MKKLLGLLMVLVVLLAQSNLALTVHYCGGKISHVDFYNFENISCKCGKKAMNSKCCSNSSVQFQSIDEHGKSEFFSSPQVKVETISLLHSANFKSDINNLLSPSVAFNAQSPPANINVAIFVWVNSFLI